MYANTLVLSMCTVDYSALGEISLYLVVGKIQLKHLPKDFG